ncbi:hypothetical protein [Micromonospora sp. NPDC051141]|uniref:hypothetical protein n=1 Tax=Micromonospora sp. NPDC051141 TaxID=3364284 RepID=UPI00379085ED
MRRFVQVKALRCVTAVGTVDVLANRLCSAATEASRTEGDDADPIVVASLGAQDLLKTMLRRWLQSKGGGSPHPPPEPTNTVSNHCGQLL